ncbi:hypothetical protein WKI13_11190 [Teredinibacter turnerae]|uniref:hypothetical protein n=1 Tax=Teredinibacter turnerae TaxID=2426 RepID=UPI0003603732|nr:hypothetical protein [Teredinibacter turnerae]
MSAENYSTIDVKSIRYISMPNNIGRRALLRLLLMRIPLKQTWVKGVNYQANSIEHQRTTERGVREYVEDLGESARAGIVGCWIAHNNALKSIKDKSGFTLVIEDDLIFRNDFIAAIKNTLRNYREHFDIAFIDPNGDGPLAKDKIKEGIYNPNFQCYPAYWGAHCMLVRNSSVNNIVEMMSDCKVEDVDGFLICHPKIKTIAVYTHKARTIYFGSNVRGAKSFDRIKGYLNWLCCWVGLQRMRS